MDRARQRTHGLAELVEGRTFRLRFALPGKGVVLRIQISDHKEEQIIDLNNFITGGRYGGWLGLAPDDSPLLLRDAGTQDVYALDWEVR